MDFVKRFWEFIKEGGYEHKNKSTGSTVLSFHISKKQRVSVYDRDFSRNPEFIILDEEAALTPLPIDEEISSLSAILLNEAL